MNKSARALTGRKARIVNLPGKNNLNGVLVELDFWNEENQMFEVRAEKTKMMLKIDLKYLIVLEPEDEEIAEYKCDEKPDVIPLENDGMTRIIGTQKYRQTVAGIWRKVDAYGNFFLQTSKRPDCIVNSMWKEMQRQNRLTDMRGLEAMNRIVQANLDKLPNMADAQLVRDLKTEKAKVDSVATKKKKMLKELKAIETARVKAEKRAFKTPDDPMLVTQNQF